MSSLISRADAALRCARARTSPATTAKPRQVNRAVAQMDQVTQQNAALVEEAAAAAGSMADQASDLQAAVAVFRLANRADS
jgi:methyl-accepting chemotaxis protein